MGLGSVNVPGLSQAERKLMKTLLVTEELDALTWDGEDTGTSVVVSDSITLYHVSDAVPTVDDLQKGYTLTAGYTYVWDEVVCAADRVSEFVVDGGNYIVLTLFDRVVIAQEGGVTAVVDGAEIVLPKAGIYFSKGSTGSFVLSLTIPGFIFGDKTYLNPDYIPPVVAIKEDVEPFIIQAWESSESGVLTTDQTLSAVADAALNARHTWMALNLADDSIVLTFAGIVTDGLAFNGVLGATSYMAVVSADNVAQLTVTDLGGTDVASAEGVSF